MHGVPGLIDGRDDVAIPALVLDVLVVPLHVLVVRLGAVAAALRALISLVRNQFMDEAALLVVPLRLRRDDRADQTAGLVVLVDVNLLGLPAVEPAQTDASGQGSL